MITTMYQVKSYRGMFDGTSPVPPDPTFDEALGYYAGFRLLVDDGTSWVCRVATLAVAVWDQDTEYDDRIVDHIPTVSAVVMNYCNNWFVGNDPDSITKSGFVFSGATITHPEVDFGTSFFEGDSIAIVNARRNDGVYAVESIGVSTMVVDRTFRTAMTDDNSVTIVAMTFPDAIQSVGARMVEYDVYRRNESPGLAQESTGTYNASKEQVDVMGHAYPASVVAGISGYKRPNIAGYTPLSLVQ